MKNKPPMIDQDYVIFYANKLKEDNKYFKQQKTLIDSQILSSKSLFRTRFGTGDNFKLKAREYLKQSKNL